MTISYQLIEASELNSLQNQIAELLTRLESAEERLTALELKKGYSQKYDYRITMIFINPPRPNEEGVIDEYIFCESLEEAKAKESEIMKRRQGIKRKILTMNEVSFKPTLYS